MSMAFVGSVEQLGECAQCFSDCERDAFSANQGGLGVANRPEVSSELRAHQQLVSVLAPSLQSMEADSVSLPSTVCENLVVYFVLSDSFCMRVGVGKRLYAAIGPSCLLLVEGHTSAISSFVLCRSQHRAQRQAICQCCFC